MERVYLNNDWYFNETYKEGMEKPDYNYEEAERVRIPHTIKEVPLHYFDEHEYQKIAAYFKPFSVPASWMEKDVYLTFDGVGHSFVVYINGKVAGEHFCGYTALTLNIKDLLDYGHNNLIMVKVNSREDQNIPPFGFVIDYMTFGGIYRDVYIEVKDPVHVADAYVSGDKDGNIRLEVQTTEAAAGKNLIVSVGGVKLGEEKIEGTSKLLNYKVDNPLLWSPEVPNLYTLKLEITDEYGIVSDEKEIRFGFRSAEFKADGFYLNGEKYKIRGLNRHQSYPYVGYAMPKNPQRNDVYILKKELGLNAVRTSHYPQSHHFIEACDEMVYCIGDGVKLRRKPGMDGEVIGYMFRGKRVQRIGRNSKWSRILWEGTRIYVAAEYLSPYPPETEAPSGETETSAGETEAAGGETEASKSASAEEERNEDQ